MNGSYDFRLTMYPVPEGWFSQHKPQIDAIIRSEGLVEKRGFNYQTVFIKSVPHNKRFPLASKLLAYCAQAKAPIILEMMKRKGGDQ